MNLLFSLGFLYLSLGVLFVVGITFAHAFFGLPLQRIDDYLEDQFNQGPLAELGTTSIISLGFANLVFEWPRFAFLLLNEEGSPSDQDS